MPKILVADDDPNILMLTTILFEDMDYEVVSATNGQEAIDKAIESKPDIILTDLIMPKKDGFDVCRSIRNIAELTNIPIVILSAMGDEYNKITGFEEGADDFITKPFNIEELKARVKALLLRSSSRKEAHAKEFIALADMPTIHSAPPIDIKIDTIPTGIRVLDDNLYGGLPKGSNILVVGPTGLGKSHFARTFMAQGLKNNQRGLFIGLDDNLNHVRSKFNQLLPETIAHFEDLGLMRFVDAYSCSAMKSDINEKFAIKGGCIRKRRVAAN